MLEAEPELDGVSICTCNCQHANCAIDALEHGVHVMLEKPFTVTLDEAIEVMRAEKKSGKILTIGYQPRMSENIQMIKKIIDSGELGKVYYMQAGGRRNGIPTPFGTTFIEKETGGAVPISSAEIVYNQAIIDGIVRSAQLGHELVIEIPEV